MYVQERTCVQFHTIGRWTPPCFEIVFTQRMSQRSDGETTTKPEAILVAETLYITEWDCLTFENAALWRTAHVIGIHVCRNAAMKWLLVRVKRLLVSFAYQPLYV